MFCLIKKRYFEDYHYIKVCWSGDHLPICPHCGQSPYEKSFDEFHSAKHQGGAE